MIYVVAIGFSILWITTSGIVTELKRMAAAFQIIAMWYEIDAQRQEQEAHPLVKAQGDGEEIQRAN